MFMVVEKSVGNVAGIATQGLSTCLRGFLTAWCLNSMGEHLRKKLTKAVLRFFSDSEVI